MNRVTRSHSAAFSLVILVFFALAVASCRERPHLTVGSKFFTEQVVLAELLAQQIEARTGLPVVRKTNLGGTLLCHKALLAGELDLYVEYTGTALTGVLNEAPGRDSSSLIYERVKKGYADRFQLELTEPLGFENTFAMVVRNADARAYQLRTISDIVRMAPGWRAGFGYEFLERPDGYEGWSRLYGLHFGETSVMDLGLIYRALVERKVDIVAGNSTDGLIAALDLTPLEDDRHYFPPYDAVPIVRRETLARVPGLRSALASLGGRISAAEIRRMNAAVDADQRDPAAVVRQFRAAHQL
jgi:osmoprotectant transport system substrate-binding protein